MIILTQASDGGIFLALFITIALFAFAAWGTHWIWFFRSFGFFRALRSFGKDNVVLYIIRKTWLRYFLGVIGLVVPIVGIIHGVLIWAGVGARVGDDPRTTFDDLPIEQQASDLRRLMLLFGAWIIVCAGMTAYELVQVEYGGAERTVWVPLAGLYNALGFWPAVLFFPALGLFGITPIAARPGLRVPGAWDGFEVAVRAILGQQITVVAAVNLAAKLVAKYGEPLRSVCGDGLTHVFPTPDSIAQAHLLGMPAARARAISTVAAAALADPNLFSPHQTLNWCNCQTPLDPWYR